MCAATYTTRRCADEALACACKEKMLALASATRTTYMSMTGQGLTGIEWDWVRERVYGCTSVDGDMMVPCSGWSTHRYSPLQADWDPMDGIWLGQGR